MEIPMKWLFAFPSFQLNAISSSVGYKYALISIAATVFPPDRMADSLWRECDRPLSRYPDKQRCSLPRPRGSPVQQLLGPHNAEPIRFNLQQLSELPTLGTAGDGDTCAPHGHDVFINT
jgi:hypothetical protein